jgi:hypothetical protein
MEKFEARNPKSETNPNDRMTETAKIPNPVIAEAVWVFEFVSSFDIRISDFHYFRPLLNHRDASRMKASW